MLNAVVVNAVRRGVSPLLPVALHLRNVATLNRIGISYEHYLLLLKTKTCCPFAVSCSLFPQPSADKACFVASI